MSNEQLIEQSGFSLYPFVQSVLSLLLHYANEGSFLYQIGL